MTDIKTIEKQTDDHVSKSLGVWPLHKRIDLLDKRTAVLQEEFVERLDQIEANHKGMVKVADANHQTFRNILDRIEALEERTDGHVRRMDYLDEKDVDLSTRIAQQKERHGFLVGEHVNGYDRLQGWMYALAGSQGLLAVGLLAEVIWG